MSAGAWTASPGALSYDMDSNFVDLLPDLALFVTVGRADSLSAASRASGVPVARLSRRLSALEQRVGVRLVERSSRRFRLTEEGAAYFASLAPKVEAISSAYLEVTEEGREPRGTLRLAASPDFGAFFLAKLVAEFAELHPQLALDIDLSPRQVDLRAERFDAAIRIGPLPDSDLTSRRFATVPGGLYAAPAYLETHGRPQLPSELVAHRCLPLPHMRETARLQRGEEVCETPMRGSVKVNSPLMLRRLCGEGLGIAALNPLVAADGGEHCPIERVLPDWSLEPAVFYFLTPARAVPARTRTFFDFARRRLEAQGY